MGVDEVPDALDVLAREPDVQLWAQDQVRDAETRLDAACRATGGSVVGPNHGLGARLLEVGEEAPAAPAAARPVDPRHERTVEAAT